MGSGEDVQNGRDRAPAKIPGGTGRIWIVAVFATFVFALLLNIFSIPAHDELAYAFSGMSTPMAGMSKRVASLADIVRQQSMDYSNANGRVFVHAIVAFFSGFSLYYVFDVLNVFAWFLLVWLVMKESGIRIDIRNFARCSAIAFMFWWYDETVSSNAAFAVNYLWMACATLAVMRLWRNIGSWWWMPAGFVFGWGQEIFSLPAIFALGASGLVSSIRRKRYALTAKQTVFLLCMAAGSAGLMLSPGILKRAETQGKEGLECLVESFARWSAGLAIAIWPAVMLACVAVLAWRFRKMKNRPTGGGMEWWLFFAGSCGFSLVIGIVTRGLYRIISGWLLAGLVLCLRNRRLFRARARAVDLFCCFSLVWMGVAAALQVSYGIQNARMLKLYSRDGQGVTFRKTVPPALWANVATVGTFNEYHLNIFRIDAGRDVPPAILSEELYMALYESPDVYFRNARRIGGYFVNPQFPGIGVKKGACAFTKAEMDGIAANAAKTGWRRFVPGRFRYMFPDAAAYVDIAGDFISFTAKDGNIYTLARSK